MWDKFLRSNIHVHAHTETTPKQTTQTTDTETDRHTQTQTQTQTQAHTQKARLPGFATPNLPRRLEEGQTPAYRIK